MKRLFYILLLFFLLLFCLCSCKNEAPPPFLQNGFSIDSDLTLQVGENRFRAHLTLDDQRQELTLKEPHSGCGITFSLDENGQAFLSFDGLCVAINRQSLPEKGLLLEAFRQKEELSFLKSKTTLSGQKALLYTLVTAEENLLIYTDRQGALLQIVIEGEDPITAVFEK